MRNRAEHKPIRAGAAVLLLLTTFTLPAAAQTGSLKLPPYRKTTLPNGMTVLLMEKRGLPLVSFNFVVRAGSVADPAGKEGLASLTAELLRRGTTSRTADQFSAQLDFIGGTFSADAGKDFTRGSAEFLTKDLATGLELLTDALLHPTFPEEEVRKLVAQNIDAIRSAKDQPGSVIGEYFEAYLFGEHPYARPTDGDERTLAAITREDVAAFYARHFAPPNTILAVVGDFSAAEMQKLLTARFGGWKGGASRAATASLPAPQEPQGRRLLLVDKPDATQTYFRIGSLGIDRMHPDRVFLDVVNTLFGGRFTSMLNSELRINSGLTYGAFSFFSERQTRGPFAINSYTRNETTVEAIDMALGILERLHSQGIGEEDLQSAKTYIKGQFPPDIETTDQLARLLTELEFYGLDEREINELFAKIDAMTLDDARRVIREHFPREHLVLVLVGKAAEIADAVKKYAPQMDRKSIADPGF